MLAHGLSTFPIRIEDPASRRRGSVYVADLAVEGPSIGRRALERGVCTLADDCTDAVLAHIEIPDTRTAFLVTEDGTHTQLELIYAEASLGRDELEAVWERRRASVDRLVVTTAGSVTPAARTFQRDHDVELLRMDPGRETETVVWQLK